MSFILKRFTVACLISDAGFVRNEETLEASMYLNKYGGIPVFFSNCVHHALFTLD
jgi:hypothetical protein